MWSPKGPRGSESMEVYNVVKCAGGAPPFILFFRVSVEVKSDLVPARAQTHTLACTVNASLNCIYPPKCASINPEGRNTDRDEDQCVSVAVQLISEIRWRPFREMRTENERREGEGSQFNGE